MEIHQALERLQARARSDAAFRRELQANLDTVFQRETGMSVTEFRQQAEHLSDGELGRIAGGTGNPRCPRCGAQFVTAQDAFLHQLSCGPKDPNRPDPNRPVPG